MRTQVPIEQSRTSMTKSPNFMANHWPSAFQQKTTTTKKVLVETRKNERPKTLGSIVANNHGVLNEIVDFEEFVNNMEGFRQQQPSLSMSSSAEIARATARHQLSRSMDEDQHDGRDNNGGDDDDDDAQFDVLYSTPQYESRQPSSIPKRRHPQPTSSKDSGNRENMPEPALPRTIQYWEEQQQQQQQQQLQQQQQQEKLQQHHQQDDAVEMSRMRETFAEIETQNIHMRAMPANNSLADEALAASPNSISGHQRATYRCHNVANRVPTPRETTTSTTTTTTKPKKRVEAHNKKGTRKPAPSSKNPAPKSIFDFASSVLTCTQNVPTAADDDGSIKTKSKEKSIWSYLDPNDDLYDSEYMKESRDDSDSSDDDDDLSDTQNMKTTVRQKRRQVGAGGHLSPRAKEKSRRDSFQRAYEDLMFIERKKNDQRHYHDDHHTHGQGSHHGKKSQYQRHHPHRIETPDTITRSLSSNSQTTIGSVDADIPSARPSPTLSQIREDLWGKVPTRRSFSEYGGGPRSAGHQQQQGASRSNTTRNQSHGGRSDPNDQAGFMLPPQHQQGQRRPPANPQTSQTISVFDPFNLEMDQPPSSQQRPDTVLNEQIDFTNTNTANNTQQSRSNAHKSRRHSVAPSKRDTKPLSNNRPRSKSFGEPLQQPAMKSSSHAVTGTNGAFCAASDYFILHEEEQVAAPRKPPASHDKREQQVPSRQRDRYDSCLPNNAADGYEQQQQENRRGAANKKRVAQHNVEILKRMEQHQHQHQQHKSRIVDYQPRNSMASDRDKARSPSSPGVLEAPVRRIKDLEGPHMYVAYSRFGEKDVLKLCEHQSLPSAITRNGKLLVKVLASTISPTDCDIRRGEWSKVRLSPYIIPGNAFVGVVQDNEPRKLSSAFSSSFKTGDIVLSLVKSGGNTRFATISKDEVIKVPQKLDPCAVVCLAETYLTAFQALHLGQRGALRYRTDAFRGQSILILGGSSCLGRALIEVAVAAGADYCYALAKDRQYEAISQLGGTPLSKNPEEWMTLIGGEINTLVSVTDSNGLYTDPVTQEHLKAVGEDGQAIFIGPPGMDCRSPTVLASPIPSSPNNHPTKLMCKSIKSSLMSRSLAYNVFDSWDADPKLAKRDLEHLVGLLEKKRLNPDVLERVPLSKVAKVHSIIETKKVPGYIVCSPWTQEPGTVGDSQRQRHQQYIV